MARLNLKLAEEKGVHEKAMDNIEDSWRTWHGPNGHPWAPYDGATHPWSATVSASLDKGRIVVTSEPHVSWWRRQWRKLQRTRYRH